MRIIAGKGRSLPLKSVPGNDTRPTTDRIKETLFNMIQNTVIDAVFLDLYSGSGGIGLEAVSRGARKAYFVENNKKAASIIQENISFTKFDAQCELICMDTLAALKRLEGKEVFDVVFMDPPYDHLHEKNMLEYLGESELINEDSLIIVEASLDTTFEYLEACHLEAVKIKKYKTNQHIFIQKKQ